MTPGRARAQTEGSVAHGSGASEVDGDLQEQAHRGVEELHP